MYAQFIALIILVTLAACQTTSVPEAPLPTLASLPTATPRPSQTPIPTLTPSPIVTPSVTPTITLTPTPTETRLPSVILLPSFTPSPVGTATPLPDIFSFGKSVQGRDLIARRFGSGERILLLVGGIHTGFETNTVGLLERVARHFENNPTAIHPNVTVIIISVLNVDGLEAGRTLVGRFNANGVDLNRNWGCDWSREAFFQDEQVNAGLEPFDQPETLALGGFIQQIQPRAVLFYHAAANGVFAGNCGSEAVSDELASLYGVAGGYPFGTQFAEYPVTGTAPSWVNSLGIPAIDIELASAEEPEYNRNLRAILTVEQWIAEASE